MIFLQIWWTVLFLSADSHESHTPVEVSPQLRQFNEEFARVKSELHDIKNAYGIFHGAQLLRHRREGINELLAQFQKENGGNDNGLKSAADAWYNQFLKRHLATKRKASTRRNAEYAADEAYSMPRKTPVKKYIKDYYKELQKTEMSKVKKKYEGQSATSILMSTPVKRQQLIKSMPLQRKFYSLRGKSLETDTEEKDNDEETQTQADQGVDSVPDRVYKQARSRLHYMDPSEEQHEPVMRNNLSHEAEYKLSKIEQDEAEASRHRARWNQRPNAYKRSSEFNPMNEIKLKTSRRLMSRGFGPSLPSNSLADTQRDMLVNDLIRRKEKRLENNQVQSEDEMSAGATFLRTSDGFGIDKQTDRFEYALPAYDNMDNMNNINTAEATDYPKGQYLTDLGNDPAMPFGNTDYGGMRTKRLSKAEQSKANDNAEDVVVDKNAAVAKERQVEGVANEKHEDAAKLIAKDNKSNDINTNEINTNEINTNEIVKLDAEQKTKHLNDAAKVDAETKAEEEVKVVNEVKLDNEPKAELSNGNADIVVKTEDELKTEGNTNAESVEPKALGDASNSVSGQAAAAAAPVKSDAAQIVNLLAKVLPTQDDNKDRAKRHAAKRRKHIHNLTRIPMSRRKRFVLSDTELFQNSRDFDTFERNEDEQRAMRVRRSAESKRDATPAVVNHTIAKRMTRLLDEMEDHNGNKHKYGNLGNGALTLDDSYELAKAVSDARDNKELNFANFLNVFSSDKGKQTPQSNSQNVQINKTNNDNDKNALSYQNYLNSLTIKNDKTLNANVNQNKGQNNAPTGLSSTYSIAVLGHGGNKNNTFSNQQHQQHQQYQQQQQQQPQHHQQLAQQQYPDCVSIPNMNNYPNSPNPASQCRPQTHDPMKLNIMINANVRGDPKSKSFFGNGSINVQPGMREDRVTRAIWSPFSERRQADNDKTLNEVDNVIRSAKDADAKKTKKSKGSSAKKKKKKGKYEHRDRIIISAPPLDPSVKEENKALFDCNPLKYSNMSYDKLITGQLSAEIVKTAIDSLSRDPSMKMLHKELKRNRCCLRKMKQLDAMCPINYKKVSQDATKQTEELLNRFMIDINKIIDNQANAQGCITLPPALRNFYELILSSLNNEEKARAKRENMEIGLAEEFNKEVRNIDPNKVEQKSRIVKKLLRQYEELPHEDQIAAASIRDELLMDLIYLRRMLEDAPRVSRTPKMSELLKKTRSYDESALKEFEGEFTSRFLKLIKVAEIFKESELDEHMTEDQFEFIKI